MSSFTSCCHPGGVKRYVVYAAFSPVVTVAAAASAAVTAVVGNVLQPSRKKM